MQIEVILLRDFRLNVLTLHSCIIIVSLHKELLKYERDTTYPIGRRCNVFLVIFNRFSWNEH